MEWLTCSGAKHKKMVAITWLEELRSEHSLRNLESIFRIKPTLISRRKLHRDGSALIIIISLVSIQRKTHYATLSGAEIPPLTPKVLLKSQSRGSTWIVVGASSMMTSKSESFSESLTGRLMKAKNRSNFTRANPKYYQLNFHNVSRRLTDLKSNSFKYKGQRGNSRIWKWTNSYVWVKNHWIGSSTSSFLEIIYTILRLFIIVKWPVTTRPPL